jgi:ABC-type Co2+ transport system permease subunit
MRIPDGDLSPSTGAVGYAMAAVSAFSFVVTAFNPPILGGPTGRRDSREESIA